TFKFKAKSLELTQHFNAKTSFILSTKQGVFLLASYRAFSTGLYLRKQISFCFFNEDRESGAVFGRTNPLVIPCLFKS
ncbi:hypothetical protein, partial [Enterococcus casseliflavus]|uniref:hypothetical protein n=1 Tax=Enterococcus casseliflavus TaxID=37734 RepID=UPI003A4C7173